MREHGMPTMNASRAFWLLWTVLLGTKLWLAAALPLFGDEAFYWLESRRFSPAHDDVPGMTPWLIGAGTALLGNTTLGVRLPFLAIGAFSAWLLLAMARSTFGHADGARAALVALLLPLFAANGLLALPDVPLTLAILCCAEALRRLLVADRDHGHRLLAFGLALGWLSHYRFVIAFAAAAAWLLISPDGRQLLRQPRVIASAALGCASGLAPLAWHQWRHGGQGLAFQFAERHPWRFDPAGLADPLLQLLTVTPGLAGLLLFAAWAGWRQRQRPGVSAWVGIGALLLGGLMLLAPFIDSERSRLHWPLPAWLLFALLVPLLPWNSWSRGARAAALAAVALAAVAVALMFGYLAALAHAPQRLAASAVYLPTFTGWREVGARVAAQLEDAPDDTVLAADNFMLAAQLSFELGGRTVYSLDHPVNRKHGRQGELDRLGLGQRALAAVASGRPVLLVLDEQASRLRARVDWFRGACDVLPGARLAFDLGVDHHQRRFIGLYRPAAASDTRTCAPPALAYLHAPAFGAELQGPRIEVRGWALRDRIGIDALWLRVDGERVAQIPYGRPEPGVRALFPGSDDPNHPQVGFAATLTLPAMAAGRHWVAIEAESADGSRSVVASVPIRWSP